MILIYYLWYFLLYFILTQTIKNKKVKQINVKTRSTYLISIWINPFQILYNFLDFLHDSDTVYKLNDFQIIQNVFVNAATGEHSISKGAFTNLSDFVVLVNKWNLLTWLIFIAFKTIPANDYTLKETQINTSHCSMAIMLNHSYVMVQVHCIKLVLKYM